MLHYYFVKYWSRIIVGTMVSIVVLVMGLFSYSLTASYKPTAQIQSSEGQKDLVQTQQAYKKSVDLYGKIQELKVNKKDTSKLEALYSESVKSLSNQDQEEAKSQLDQLELQIGIMNTLASTQSAQPLIDISLVPSPFPSEPAASPSGINGIE